MTKHPRPASLAILTVALITLLAATGAEPDRAAFYRPPQLFVMTGFIANTTNGTWGTDFVGSGDWTPGKQVAALAQWNKGLGKEYDPDRELAAFKRAGATGIIFYDKWHDGNVPHDTKLTAYKTERDLVGPTLRAARKLGLRTVVYYSVGLDSNPETQFRDWVCRDDQGRPMGRAFPTDWMSFHSPYRQYVIGHLVEILKMHGPVDGLWLDLYTQPEPSYDTYSKQAFEKRFGKAMEKGTPAEFHTFETETRRDFLIDIRKAVDAAQPGVAITFNGAGVLDTAAPRVADRVDRLADFFSMEGHTWSGIDRGAIAGHNTNRPFEVGMLISSSWYVPMDDAAPPPAMSEDEAVASAAWALVRGSNVYAAMTPGHSGRFDPQGDVRLLAAMGSWLAKQKPWIEGATPYADIGVVRGTPNDELERAPSVSDLWPITYHRRAPTPARSGAPGSELDAVLRDSGYFSEVLGSAFPRRSIAVTDYRLLVLPENGALDQSLTSSIRSFVQMGGKVLAFGNASRLDAMGRKQSRFGLADVFGVELVGELPGYKQLRHAPDSGLTARLRVNPGALHVRATTGRVLATWRSAGDAPAIVENRLGKGTAVYVTADELSCAQNPEFVAELAARLIGAPPVSMSKAARKYAMLMNRKGDDLILYLFNRSTGSRAYSESGMVPESLALLPPESLELRFNTGILGEIRGVELVPDMTPARLSVRSGEAAAFVEAAGSVTALRLKK
jgi:hypothetical protein